MQKYNNLGQVFKNLRTNRHISLKQISNEEVSVSQLSRFERGESDLSIGKLLIALENMNVEVSEFIDAVHNNQHRIRSTGHRRCCPETEWRCIPAS